LKKTFSLFALLALLAVLLSACGLVSVSVSPEYLATATAEPEPTASPTASPTEPVATLMPLSNAPLDVIEGVFRPAAEGDALSTFPGEVMNRSDVALGFIKVTFTFVNDAGEVIYEGRVYSDVPFVLPGSAAPYEYILDSQDLPEGETWSSYEVSVTAQPRQTYSGVSMTEMTVEQDGDYYGITGTFSNIGEGVCELPLVVVVGYNDDDLVVMSRRVPPVDENLDAVSSLEAGKEVPVEITLQDLGIANLRVIAVCEK
jgi:hypothetical protein